MSDTVISVENISKLYRLGEVGTGTLSHDFNRWWHKVRGKEDPYLKIGDQQKSESRNEQFEKERQNAESQGADTSKFQLSKFPISTLPSDYIWAIKDISFEVKRGEVLGIIGRNGAGKSTLLKILSRVTTPTSGEIKVKGRIASLLEVGTGFNPELTGRDNIYLNGAILGMRKREIDRKFDEIVDFSGVERYIDTPVKRYSSGMYVRLAFAVAAHLEPEILIVDEVLAVGDAEFQKKCLGKMQDVASQGRTVLFVSHNMPSIQRLCSRAILFCSGRIESEGTTDQVIQSYLSNAASVGRTVDLTSLPKNRRRGNGTIRFTRVDLYASDGRTAQEIRQGEPMIVQLQLYANNSVDQVLFGFSFVAADGTEIMGTAAHDGGVPNYLDPGSHIFDCEINPMILCPGRYFIRAAIFRQEEIFDHIDEMIGFDVINIAFDLSIAPANHLVGHVYLPFKWNHVEQPKNRNNQPVALK